MMVLHPPWLTHEAVQKFLHVASVASIEVRFVGGAVRDALLGQTSRYVGTQSLDLDVTTPALPDAVMDLYQQAGCTVIPTGLAHGTVTIRIADQSFEVTTLRADVACDGRHAEVRFTDDWCEDALRRDFTMNALMMDAAGNIYDTVGGIDDARAGRVRFIGDPVQRMKEDYLRIIRFFRFYAAYGRVAPDAATYAAITAQREGVTLLAQERIQHEMRKLLSTHRPDAAINAMYDCGVLQLITQRDAPPNHMPNIRPDAPIDARFIPWMRLMALYPDAVEAIATRWKCSKEVQRWMRAVRDSSFLRRQESSNNSWSWIPAYAGMTREKHAMLCALYRGGREKAYAAWWLHHHGISEEEHQSLIALEIPIFPITGSMLRERGMNEGKEIGEALRSYEAKWIASGFRLD
ncbi:MAG: CCA tRNA nucleotidyltransferase [Alphaproteobacteria bacterium]|nr:MAG: CCA tRNA nucleotidyltransferase [Alphaproteobacteria bacterium]TAF13199.1 MAG: CCA tRNA nucleotidyltransferase [Alphaproteobacteria bacterium]TAF40231.1 MAG: CCA tRNA nucleotidyltransferase [Alphaproteobacteria bacterium]TAF77360.1 MAG: CCA tRNA nucleotidyltransferase [Alphaproteobacteria bacterium]